ncbi:hypothetical protein [Shimia sp.]|uniref:hypothetical protein n=1 Tax=Shimia sp. TaxID=1954381 RepID=UPI0032992034
MKTRTFIAAVITAAMTLTGVSASSARALTEDDVAKLMIGATALFILGKAIDDNKKSKPKAVIQPTRRYEPKHVTKPNTRNTGRANPHRRNLVLPVQCKRNFVTERGKHVTGFRRVCLNRSGVSVNHLPGGCERQVNTQRGWKTIYGANCMHRSGYRVGNR